MNLQDYLLRVPYQVSWHLLSALGRTSGVVFYCTDPLDYVMFEPIRAKLSQPVSIYARNSKTSRYLKSRGVEHTRLFPFPRAVIMARHSPYKFPVKAIRKVGFDHGLYQFKRWTATKYYNGFDVYMVSSEHQVEIAKSRGIQVARAIGYPKLDRLFDGTFDEAFRNDLRKELGFDPAKKTVMLTSTWDVAGMSALDRWVDRAGELAAEFNVMATCHTWTAPNYVEKLKNTAGVQFLGSGDVTPHFSITDALVGDSNSLLGEFCALDRPIVTFRVPDGERTIPEIKAMIASISVRQVDDFEQMREALRFAVANPLERSAERRAANAIMHYKLDGRSSDRAAQCILETIAPKRS